jgi:RND family efflux transporter MFP subunit
MSIALSAPLALAMALALCACTGKPEEKKAAAAPPTQITATQSRLVTLEVREDTLGTLEAVIDPTLRAEVAGRVVKVMVRPGDRVKQGQPVVLLDERDAAIQNRSEAAEVRRLQSLLAQQERLVQRQDDLVQRGFVSRNVSDDARAQRDALREQLAAARARAEAAATGLARTLVTSPIDGAIEVQIVATGDYVKVGDPLLRMVSNRRLRAHLPFPETAAARMRPGLAVRITSPQNPESVVEGVIDDLRPTVSEGSRALDVIARFDNPGQLLAGGTVDASVVVDTKRGVVMVPEQSVVLRPAGKVVYAVKEGKVEQRVVETGVKQDGMVEIVRGLAGDVTVALDGAGFLSDGAVVSVREKGSAQKREGADGRKAEKPSAPSSAN